MRGPGRCPTCNRELEIRRLYCPDCQVSIEGKFSPCPFCGLDEGELQFVLTFLQTRGNIKEMERSLGISYPTVRSRLGHILHLLGLGDGAQSEVEAGLLKKEQRRLVLEKLEQGEIDAAEAVEQLRKIKSEWEGILMSQEMAKVLQMIEEGKLTADEGLALLEPLQEDDAGVSPPLQQEQTDPGRKKKLRIKISDALSGKTKVNLSIPVGLVKLLPGLIPEGIKKRAGDIDFSRLLDDFFEGLAATDPAEKLIDLVDDDNGDRVEIYFA